MQLKTLSVSLLFFFLLTSCTWADASLSIRDSLTDFGYVPTKSAVIRTLVFYSTGTDTLLISEVNTTCSCLKMPLEQNVIPPGESLLVPLIYESELNIGIKDRYPYIYTNARKAPYRIAVKTTTAENMSALSPITVFPFRVLASKLDDNYAFRFTFELQNDGENPVTPGLVYQDDSLFDVRLPAEIPPGETVVAELVLTPQGVKTEFLSSFTFEYIGKDGRKTNHSVPVIRKIYRKD